MANFSIGQMVTVWKHGFPIRLRTVKMVGKRRFLLDDGSSWTLDGTREWRNRLSGLRVHVRRPSDEETIRRLEASFSMISRKWL